MQNNDMNRFLAALLRCYVPFAGLLAALLIGVAILLIWKPRLLLQILRYGLAALCAGSAGALLVSAVRTAWACKKCPDSAPDFCEKTEKENDP